MSQKKMPQSTGSTTLGLGEVVPSGKPPRPSRETGSLDRRRNLSSSRHERDGKSRSTHSLKEKSSSSELRKQDSMSSNLSLNSKDHLYDSGSSNNYNSSGTGSQHLHHSCPPHSHNSRLSPGIWEPPPPPPLSPWDPHYYWSYPHHHPHHQSREELRLIDYHRRQQELFQHGSNSALGSTQDLSCSSGCCSRNYYHYPPVPPCCSMDHRPQWSNDVQRHDTDERLRRLQKDKESLALQVKTLTEQMQSQSTKLSELENMIKEKNQLLSNAEDLLQRPREFTANSNKSYNSQDAVCLWFDHLGLSMYEEDLRRWLKPSSLPGSELMKASPVDFEKELPLRNPLHRKKIVLAIADISGTANDDELFKCAGKLDTSWVQRWLDDVGMPQYKDTFIAARMDGRMLHKLTMDDLVHLQMSSCLHVASIRRGIQLMRSEKWNPDCLIRRPLQVNLNAKDDVRLWTSQRVHEWLRAVDLAEYAPNLRGSGVHGALMIFEVKFTAELFADLLNIPSSKTLLRRHLATHFKDLLGRDIIQVKREAENTLGFQPLTISAKIKQMTKDLSTVPTACPDSTLSITNSTTTSGVGSEHASLHRQPSSSSSQLMTSTSLMNNGNASGGGGSSDSPISVHLAEYHNRTNNCNETVACKLIDTKKCSEKFRKRFLPRELTILLHVRHPYIVRIHAIIKCRSKICIFMRYAEMGDMLSFVIEHGPLGEPQTRIWCRQLALAVQYLHESGIAHRDLKCENILLSANLNVKLSDFGFARYVAEKNRQPQLSTTFCGSFDYSAPELLKGKPYNPKASDLWALGVVLYMLLNKSIPFKGKTRQVYEQQMARAWKFRTRVNDALSPEVKTLVRSLLEPNPLIRWTIEEVLKQEYLLGPLLIWNVSKKNYE
uniref:Protein kinase domain-containing protein n=1 Tax=Anopheles culicifacies TaxID=139723 RepID=A0A182MCU2_9DIPT